MCVFSPPAGQSGPLPDLSMAMRLRLCLPAALFSVAVLSACTPTYDWREIHGSDVPYTVLLPAKPSTYSRQVNLGPTMAIMTMTAVEIDAVTFAVATAQLPDAAQAQAALVVMKNTLVSNLHAIVRQEHLQHDGNRLQITLDATPAPPAAGATAGSAAAAGKAPSLHARFLARGRQVYQVIVVGPDAATPPDAVAMFLSSFKID